MRRLVLTVLSLAFVACGTSDDGGAPSHPAAEASTGGAGGKAGASGGGGSVAGGGTSGTGGAGAAGVAGAAGKSGAGPTTGGSAGGAGAAAGAGGGGAAGAGGGPAGSAGSGGAVPDLPGVFVAVGYGGRRVRSLDGMAWTDDQELSAKGGDDDTLLRAVAYGDGRFVAVGWRTMTSTDGKQWADHGKMGQWLGGVARGPSGWVAVGGYGRRSTSVDGFTWTDHDGPDKRAYRGLAFGNVAGGRFVGVGDQGRCDWSKDGVTWVAAKGDAVGGHVIGFGAGAFVACDGGKVVASFDGGETWGVTLASADCDGVAYGKGTFVVTGPDRVYLSADAKAWTQKMVSGLGGAVVFGGGAFVAARGSDRRVSADGTTWSAPVKGGTNSLESVAFGAP